MTHNPLIEEEVEKFENSEVMKRISLLESFCHTHGFPEYKGKTLQEEFASSLQRALLAGEKKGAEGVVEMIEKIISTNEDETWQIISIRTKLQALKTNPSVT